MANYCKNVLTVTSKSGQLKVFLEKFNSLESIVPYLGDHDEDWCLENWGTKYDLADLVSTPIPNGMQYSFLTTWCPPLIWVYKAASKFPKLRFELLHGEPGSGCCGKLMIKKGYTEEINIDATAKKEYMELLNLLDLI